MLALALACSPTSTDDTGTDGAGTTVGGTGTTVGGTGTTGSPTTGGPTGPGFCVPQCDQEGQPCRVNGFATDYLCIAGVCEFSACKNDDVCHRRAAQWDSDCLDNSMCTTPGYDCIAFEGAGVCAPLEDPMVGCPAGLVPLVVTLYGTNDDVTVCADTASRCIDGNCFFPCQADADCPADKGQPHCDLPSGECRCSDDAECLASGTPGLVACTAGTCGCKIDGDCAGGTNIDVCINGACGCSSSAVCSVKVFDNAVEVCQPS